MSTLNERTSSTGKDEEISWNILRFQSLIYVRLTSLSVTAGWPKISSDGTDRGLDAMALICVGTRQARNERAHFSLISTLRVSKGAALPESLPCLSSADIRAPNSLLVSSVLQLRVTLVVRGNRICQMTAAQSSALPINERSQREERSVGGGLVRMDDKPDKSRGK